MKTLLFFFSDRKEYKRGEPYRLISQYDYLKPPHKGKLCYEGTIIVRDSPLRMARNRFDDFKNAVKDYYDSKTTKD